MSSSLRPRRSWRVLLTAAVCSFTLLAGPTVLLAAEPAAEAPPASAAQPAPADKPADTGNMPGCPGNANGGCCEHCQQGAQSQPAAPAAGGCPCQRAKQAQQGS